MQVGVCGLGSLEYLRFSLEFWVATWSFWVGGQFGVFGFWMEFFRARAQRARAAEGLRPSAEGLRPSAEGLRPSAARFARSQGGEAGVGYAGADSQDGPLDS